MLKFASYECFQLLILEIMIDSINICTILEKIDKMYSFYSVFRTVVFCNITKHHLNEQSQHDQDEARPSDYPPANGYIYS